MVEKSVEKLVEKLVEKDKISIALLWAGRIPNGLNFSEYMNFSKKRNLSCLNFLGPNRTKLKEVVRAPCFLI